jgi:hypothetical protein
MGKLAPFLTHGRTFGGMLAGLFIVVALVYFGVPNA